MSDEKKLVRGADFSIHAIGGTIGTCDRYAMARAREFLGPGWEIRLEGINGLSLDPPGALIHVSASLYEADLGDHSEECPHCAGPLNRDGSCAASCAGVGDQP